VVARSAFLKALGIAGVAFERSLNVTARESMLTSRTSHSGESSMSTYTKYPLLLCKDVADECLLASVGEGVVVWYSLHVRHNGQVEFEFSAGAQLGEWISHRNEIREFLAQVKALNEEDEKIELEA
jgi:hypothetical protein